MEDARRQCETSLDIQQLSDLKASMFHRFLSLTVKISTAKEGFGEEQNLKQ